MSDVKFSTIRFANEEQSRLHKSVLEMTTVGEIPSKFLAESIPPEKNEVWEVVAEWDAVPELPKKSTEWLLFGYPEEHFYPEFISWNPDGNSLITSRDHKHLTTWSLSGERINGNQIKDTFGWGNQCFWSKNGSWVLYCGTHRILAHGNDSEWLSVYDSNGLCKTKFNWNGYDPSFVSRLNHSNSKVPIFNPWRPTKFQFISLKSWDWQFVLHDTASLSERLEASSQEVIDLSVLKTPNGEIASYAWHPNGRYLAFLVIELGNDVLVRRIHLLDWDSAEIILSTPPIENEHISLPPNVIGWSPGGRWLVLDYHATTIWDVKSGEIRKTTENERKASWIRRLLVGCDEGNSQRGFDWCSPDGKRYLLRREKHLELWATAGSLQDPSGKTVEYNDWLKTFSGIQRAAWCPTDPHCFAAVGGDDAPWSVRIWRLKEAT